MNKIVIEKINFYGTQFHYQIYKEGNNLDFIKKLFPTQSGGNTKKQSIQINLNELQIEDSRLSLLNHNFNHHNKGVDFSDLDLNNLNVKFTNIKWNEDSVSVNIENLRLNDKSGFKIQSLTARTHISKTKIEFKEMLLEVNSSHYTDYLLFEFDSFNDFGNFIKNVRMKASIRNSYVDSRDIEFFAHAMRFVHFKTHVHRATFEGTVANFNVSDVHLETQELAQLFGNISVQGLPNINSTIFEAQIEKLNSSIPSIESLISGLANRQNFTLPEQLHRLSTVDFEGYYIGKYNDFRLDGHINTQLGSIQSDMQIKIDKNLSYKGSVQSSNFAIGDFLDNNRFGGMDLDLHIDGQGLLMEDLDINTRGILHAASIDSLHLQNILVDAHLSNKVLSLESKIYEDKIKADFKTIIDFNNIENIQYTIGGDIDYAHLKGLHLIRNDNINIKNSRIDIIAQGNSLNEINGNFKSSLNLSKGDRVLNLGTIHLDITGEMANKNYNLQSDFVQLVLQGEIDFNTLVPYFESLAVRYAPAIGITPQSYNAQNFNLELVIHSFEPLSILLDPEFKLADGASLRASFSSNDHKANFQAFSPLLNYKGVELQNIKLYENADGKEFALNLYADRLNFSDSLYIHHITVNNKLANDSLHFVVQASEEALNNYLNLSGFINFAHNKPAYVSFYKSILKLNDEDWDINEDSKLRLSKGRLYIDDLWLRNNDQQISIDGVLSNDIQDVVNVRFNHFSLSSLSGFTTPLGIDLIGQINGVVNINSVFSSPHLSANITTTPILYNSLPIGTLHLTADVANESNLVNIGIELLDRSHKGLKMQGTYQLGQSNSIALSGSLQDFDIFVFQPFLKNLISEMHGTTTGDFTVKGNIGKPVFQGNFNITNAGFKVNYLQVPYYINQQAFVVLDNKLLLSDFSFKDIHGNSGIAKGHIDLNLLSNISMDVAIKAQNLLVLNTTFKDNNLYYGRVFGSGSTNFKGSVSNLDIDITASSNPNTQLTLPFNASTTLEKNDFIYFKSEDIQTSNISNKKLFDGITLRLNMNLNQDAEVNIYTNMGALSGNGNGEITLVISSLGDFEMFGDYVVNKGKFHFTAQDLFNKYFDIEEGATLRWTGKPAEAIINMKALYQQRTSVSALYNAAGQTPNDQRVLAQANMNLRGNLSRPEISFDLNFPQEPYIKDELQGYLSDINNVNQQALSLIVRRSFTPSSTLEIGKEVNNTLLSAGTEIAFNQLNAILSQSLNIDFFDLNIRSLNDASASFRFFDDRLILTGGVSDRRNLQLTDLSVFSDRIATDAELIYKLRKDGNLIFRANNRLNTRNFLLNPNDEYISAVGLIYRQEFNSLSEFWRRLWMRPTRKKEKDKEVEKEEIK